MCVCVCVYERETKRNMTRILDNDEYVAAAKRLFIARSINIEIVTLPLPARVSPTLYRLVIARSLQEIINSRTLYYLLMKQHVSRAECWWRRRSANCRFALCVRRRSRVRVSVFRVIVTRPSVIHGVVSRMIKETNNFEKPPIYVYIAKRNGRREREEGRCICP